MRVKRGRKRREKKGKPSGAGHPYMEIARIRKAFTSAVLIGGLRRIGTCLPIK